MQQRTWLQVSRKDEENWHSPIKGNFVDPTSAMSHYNKNKKRYSHVNARLVIVVQKTGQTLKIIKIKE